MKFFGRGAVAVWLAARSSTALPQPYGVRSPTYPPIELFGGAPVYRFRWSEQSNYETGLCLIDWSMPNTSLQPFGTWDCTEFGAPADMGAQWLPSTRINAAKTDRSKNFEGLLGNMGTGRCMEWKPAPANETAHSSSYSATTYGTLTSEICDKNNQYQYFKLDNWKDPNSRLDFRPRMWNTTCPEDQSPTIIAGPERSLIAYGCGKGLWIPDAITAGWGWSYYDAIQEKQWRIEVNSDRYQTILCCQRDKSSQDTPFCKMAMQKEGQGDRSPSEFWMQMCTELFPNYPEFDKERSGGGQTE